MYSRALLYIILTAKFRALLYMVLAAKFRALLYIVLAVHYFGCTLFWLYIILAADYSQVDMLGLRYTSVNLRAGKQVHVRQL